jgi:hypothetical protein
MDEGGKLMLLKECARCELYLEVTKNFYVDKSKADGFQSYCKDCKRELNGLWIAEWREKNPVEAKERHRADYRRVRQRRGAKREAAESGVLRKEAF